MLEKLGRIRLLYIVLGVLLLVGLLPLAFAGFLLSGRSADELRSIEGRYQAQLVQDKARQIELYGQRYRDVVTGLARASRSPAESRLSTTPVTISVCKNPSGRSKPDRPRALAS